MATRPPVSMPKLTRRSRLLLIIGGLLLLALLLGSRVVGTYIDWLWFGEVDARGVFTTVLFTKFAMFAGVGLVVGGVVALSLAIAYRTRPVFVPVASEDDPLARYRSTVVARVRLFGIGIPTLVGVIAGATAQGDWKVVQLFFNGGDFGQTDPEFGKDVGFYVFDLPFYNWIMTWIFVAIGLGFVAAAITHYLFGGIRLAGKGGQFTNPARIQLAITAGFFVLFKAVEYFIDRYNLLLAGRNELFTGASYTDLQAVMPAKLILMSIAVFCAIALFAGAVLRNLLLPAIALVLLLVSGILVGTAWPAMLWQFSVKPNEIAKEADAIKRNMDSTKFAYGLDKIEYKDYEPESQANVEDIQGDKATIEKIRLLDPSVLEPTFTQRVARENFYGFPEKLDVDRYTINGETQDYIVAAREMKTEGLVENQRSWINQRLVYTHGNGFVLAPANTIDRAVGDGSAGSEGGYPIARRSDTDSPEGSGIDVKQPRIYYGELVGSDDDYAIVGNPDSAPGEFDTATKTHRYQGKGGVSIDSFFQRIVFGIQHGERNILFSDAIGDGSKIMYNRDPRTRVEKKAPWLTVDGDPYPAVIDGRIKWIIDGYTTTANFPYGQKTQLGEATADTLTGVARQQNENISYIRNSVKATVDAYDGDVKLYSIDDDEPVLKAWRSIFPGTVEPESAVSEELRQHFRYPADMFKVQRDLLTRYHVDTPQEYFSNTAWWSIPPNPTESDNTANQPPYYLLMNEPGKQGDLSFQLTSALTPLRRDYLASWMTVSSEPGSYGKMTVLRLPTAERVQSKGPLQVQNAFESDNRYVQDRTLLNNPNVTVINGNQLTLPVGGGFMYVEPIYIRQNRENSFPQLARVLVSFGDNVGFANTLPEAMDQVFGQGAGELATAPRVDDGTGGQEPAPTDGEQPEETPPAEEPGAPSGDMAEAAAEMQAAYAKFKQAQSDNDYAAQAEALEELDAAAKKYDEAVKADGG